MKTLPFVISTLAAAIALVFGVLSLTNTKAGNAIAEELIKKQAELQKQTEEITRQNDKNEDVAGQLTLLQQEFQRQQQIIEAGTNVAQKLGPPILRDLGYLAVKNNNEKLRNLLVRAKFESFLPTPEQARQIDAQIEKARAAQGAGAAPAPAPGR